LPWDVHCIAGLRHETVNYYAKNCKKTALATYAKRQRPAIEHIEGELS